MSSLSLEQFLTSAEKVSVVDVRTPSEFNQGHIPGASNVPLFSDEERAEIGTVYKQISREQAIDRGLELVGPRMTELARLGKSNAQDNKLLAHCWRGGMRSESFAWLMNTTGVATDTLEGGYKTFRRAALDIYDEEQLTFILIGGATGSGKTDILKELQKLGEQVIDLEGLANHKGSAFGGIGHPAQPTSEQFQNELYCQIINLDWSRPIWLENESSYIGKVGLPEKLWKRMTQSQILEVCVPKEERVKRLVREYGDLDKKEMEAAILRIGKKLGPEQTKTAIDTLYSEDLSITADLLLSYYDKSYDFLLERRSEFLLDQVTLSVDDPGGAAEMLVEKLNERSK